MTFMCLKSRVCKEKQLYRNIPNHDHIWIVTEGRDNGFYFTLY